MAEIAEIRKGLPFQYKQALYFLQQVHAEVAAVQDYVHPWLCDIEVSPDDFICCVKEQISDELQHALKALSLACRNLGIFPSQDDLDDILGGFFCPKQAEEAGEEIAEILFESMAEAGVAREVAANVYNMKAAEIWSEEGEENE